MNERRRMKWRARRLRRWLYVQNGPLPLDRAGRMKFPGCGRTPNGFCWHGKKVDKT